MTSMIDCPDCGAKLQAIVTYKVATGEFIPWKYCPICEWNERRQLMEKMSDESKNSPGP